MSGCGGGVSRRGGWVSGRGGWVSVLVEQGGVGGIGFRRAVVVQGEGVEGVVVVVGGVVEVEVVIGRFFGPAV